MLFWSKERTFANAMKSALLALSMMSASAALAQSGNETNQASKPKLPAWIVTCSNANAEAKLKCSMQQSLFVTASGQRVMTMTLERDPKEPSRVQARLMLPHGIFLAEGVSIWVDDGEKKKIPVSYGDANGSYAQFTVDATLTSALAKGSVFRVATKPIGGEDLVIELDLTGFAASYALLTKDF
jgi:invasion protein IalB